MGNFGNGFTTTDPQADMTIYFTPTFYVYSFITNPADDPVYFAPVFYWNAYKVDDNYPYPYDVKNGITYGIGLNTIGTLINSRGSSWS